MKKTILILAIMGMMFSSCSSDSGGSGLAVTYENLDGIWYMKEIIKADGSMQAYPNVCDTKRDSVEFSYPRIDYFSHYENCESYLYSNTNSYYLSEGDYRIVTSSSVFIDAKVTELTSQRLRLEYDVIKSFPYPGIQLNSIKGFILTRE